MEISYQASLVKWVLAFCYASICRYMACGTLSPKMGGDRFSYVLYQSWIWRFASICAQAQT